jgi:hypothetical protein
VTAQGRKRVETKVTANDAETATVNVTAPPAEAPPPPAPQPPPPPPPQPRWTPPPQPRGVLVHIQSDDPSKALTLRRVDSEFSGSGPMFGYGQSGPMYGVSSISGNVNSVVCLAPCDTWVGGPSGQEFFLGGDGIHPSSNFMLPATGRIGIKASPGSKLSWGAGVVFVALGGAAAGTGGVVLAVSQTNSMVQGFAVPGGAMLGAGLAVLAIGIPLMLNGRTTYTLEPSGVALRF